jgi:hypothetical protein
VFPDIRPPQHITAGFLRSMLPLVAWKPGNTDRANTATVADDPDLVLALAAGATYLVEALLMPAATTTANFKTAWTVPNSATGLKAVDGPSSTASNANADQITVRRGVHQFGTEILYSGVRNNNTLSFGVYEWGLITTSSAGNWALAWSQGTSNATATRLFGGSFVRAQRVA